MAAKDLTKGGIIGPMLSFALPLILGNMLQTLYNAADSVIVGRFVGPDALAAVGSAYSLMTFLTSLMIGLSMGAGISFSYFYVALLGWILRILSVPEGIVPLMSDYLLVIFTGLPALFLFSLADNMILAWIMLLVLAFSLYFAFSTMVVLGQQFLARNIGFASGVTLGLSTAVGGISAPIIGWIGDHFGLVTSFQVMAGLAVIATVVTFFIDANANEAE